MYQFTLFGANCEPEIVLQIKTKTISHSKHVQNTEINKKSILGQLKKLCNKILLFKNVKKKSWKKHKQLFSGLNI